MVEKTPLRAVGTQPLLDKTPFTNRTTGRAPQTQRTSKLALISPVTAPLSLVEQTPLPSATRSHPRAPRPSHGPALPQTPAVSGNPWDVSDGSIRLGQSTGLDQSVGGALEEEPDEIEYMPPKAIGAIIRFLIEASPDNLLEDPDPPFEFPFDGPDYAEVGKTLLESAFSPPTLEDQELFIPPFILDPEELKWDHIDLHIPDDGAFYNLLSHLILTLCHSDGDDLLVRVKPAATPSKPAKPRLQGLGAAPAKKTAPIRAASSGSSSLHRPTASSSHKGSAAPSRPPSIASRAGSIRSIPSSTSRPTGLAVQRPQHNRTVSVPVSAMTKHSTRFASSTNTRAPLNGRVASLTQKRSSPLVDDIFDDGLVKLSEKAEMDDFMFDV